MKHLLIVLAILILGCGTVEVVEEPPPVPEETLPAAEEPPRLILDNHEDRILLQLVDSNVISRHGKVAFDPVLLNQEGIFFKFSKDLSLFTADLTLDGKSLKWFPLGPLTGENVGSSVRVTRLAGSTLLLYDDEYVIELFCEDNGKGNRQQAVAIQIKFETIPRP